MTVLSIARISQRKTSLSPFGFIVLLLLFQRTFGSFSDVTMEYLLVSVTVSALSWLALAFGHRHLKSHQGGLFLLAGVFLFAAFGIQESIFLASSFLPGFLAHKAEAVVLSATCFAFGYALYCLLWLSAFERKEPRNSLLYIALSSGISALVAAGPPLVFGTDSVGSLISFILRLLVLTFTFVCLKKELAALPEYEEESATTASTKEVWSTVGVIVIAVIVARFIQGLIVFNETNYKEFGPLLIVIASPLIAACILVLVRQHGEKVGFTSIFYWALIMFASIMLLVPAAVADGPIGFLWVFQFASYAQFDIAFLGVLSSLRKSFGQSFFRFICLAFFAKELAFLAGRLLRGLIDPSLGSLICVIVLVGFIVFAIVSFLIQSMRDSYEKDEPGSIPQALSVSIAEHYGLTSREEDVLLLLLEGRSYTSIGHKLFISRSTVKTHSNHIYGKLAVGSRDELLDLLNPSVDIGKSTQR
ncbi:MAG: helix-turn-helix transcriptional regulator [Coriobacteriales bacterium]|jgi:DNA-binding CsgD family transcriptional regulator|nr:helix-turn-helix transcriptional regulator [Coriobacteriales bacterium]